MWPAIFCPEMKVVARAAGLFHILLQLCILRALKIQYVLHLPRLDDDSKQKEIENLQRRIDQLQWELDNADTVRLQNNVGDAVQKLRDIYAETTQEVLRLHLTSQQYGNSWTRMIARMRYDSEVYEKSIEKIADVTN